MSRSRSTSFSNDPHLQGELFDVIRRKLQENSEQMVRFRRDLHAHPELAGEEFRTTDRLAERMNALGYDLHDLPGTGVVADLHVGGPDDRWMAIRSDIDCVPIDDEKSVSWRSRNKGRCHACGHDAHATMALFAGEALASQRLTLEEMKLGANLRIIFQPAEETAMGAKQLITAGVVNGVQNMVALHCDPFLDVGSIGIRSGPITSCMSTFRITISGEGGHSARPHEAIDPVPAAVNVASMLYQLAPRSMDSRYAMCLTITSLTAGEAFNAIPDKAVLCGTLRAGRAEDLEKVKKAMDRCIRGVCEATGCGAALEFPYTAPATDNHQHPTNLIEQAARSVVDESGIIHIELPSLGGEDFAYFQQVIPGSMARLGTGSGAISDRRPLHSSCFDIDENALPIGSLLLAATAVLGMAEEAS
ncbi:MAG: N-acyl-L-amino acid amidohydrolase [Phycisphaerae bacterium]|nr:N-acyl-L-amino acid amidohydrolase [Phycisphaerae bacterium]|tara:strand:- start:9720 stop:10973 length:1254 start_codon:yes stop_codon:yes gene_type:complete